MEERKIYIQESFGNEEDKTDVVESRVEFDTRQTEQEDLEEVNFFLIVFNWM